MEILTEYLSFLRMLGNCGLNIFHPPCGPEKQRKPVEKEKGEARIKEKEVVGPFPGPSCRFQSNRVFKEVSSFSFW